MAHFFKKRFLFQLCASVLTLIYYRPNPVVYILLQKCSKSECNKIKLILSFKYETTVKKLFLEDDHKFKKFSQQLSQSVAVKIEASLPKKVRLYWVVVVAQLVEGALQTPEIRGSIPVIGMFIYFQLY